MFQVGSRNHPSANVPNFEFYWTTKNLLEVAVGARDIRGDQMTDTLCTTMDIDKDRR